MELWMQKPRVEEIRIAKKRVRKCNEVSCRNQTSYCSQPQPPNSCFPDLKSSDSIFVSLMTSSITQLTFPSPYPQVNIILSHLVHQLNVIIT